MEPICLFIIVQFLHFDSQLKTLISEQAQNNQDSDNQDENIKTITQEMLFDSGYHADLKGETSLCASSLPVSWWRSCQLGRSSEEAGVPRVCQQGPCQPGGPARKLPLSVPISNQP